MWGNYTFDGMASIYCVANHVSILTASHSRSWSKYPVPAVWTSTLWSFRAPSLDRLSWPADGSYRWQNMLCCLLFVFLHIAPFLFCFFNLGHQAPLVQLNDHTDELDLQLFFFFFFWLIHIGNIVSLYIFAVLYLSAEKAVYPSREL